jgi:hypothetical protein
MDIDARRKELIGELNEFQMQDRFITDTRKTIQELNEERDSHSEIIHQINQASSCFQIASGRCFVLGPFPLRIVTFSQQKHALFESTPHMSWDANLPSVQLDRFHFLSNYEIFVIKTNLLIGKSWENKSGPYC